MNPPIIKILIKCLKRFVRFPYVHAVAPLWTFNFVRYIIFPVPFSLAPDRIAKRERRALIHIHFSPTERKPPVAEHPRGVSPAGFLASSLHSPQGFLESSQLTTKLSRIVTREALTNSEPAVKRNLWIWLPGSCQGLAPSSKCMGHRSSGGRGRGGHHD